MLIVVLVPHFKFQKSQCMYMARLTCVMVSPHKSRGKSPAMALMKVCTFHEGDMRA